MRRNRICAQIAMVVCRSCLSARLASPDTSHKDYAKCKSSAEILYAKRDSNNFFVVTDVINMDGFKLAKLLRLSQVS